MSFLSNFFSTLTKTNSDNTSKSRLIKAIQTADSLTENGALTHSTSDNNLVDLFFLAGASRTIGEDQILTLLEKSFAFNQLLTVKLIFWAGDVRCGAGERRFFRLALKWLETHHPQILIKNIEAGNVEFFNRWDSLFALVDNKEVKEVVLNHVVAGLENQDGLLAKWLPRKDQYNNFKKQLQQKLKINDEKYRKLIVHLSKTVEQQMCANNWEQIHYPQVPSQAFNKYREAFLRHDEARFNQFVQLALAGQTKINAGAIFPHQLYQAYNQNKDENSIVAQWNNLPNFLEGSMEKILPICDVSGSMTGVPLDVCVALGIYISERNKGIFQNAFVTFSQQPKIQYLQGTLAERIRQLETAEWAMNTDLNKVFELLLTKAAAEKISREEMPSMLLIFSDMEFDEAVKGQTNLEAIKRKYERSGYKMAKIVFWNLRGRPNNLPAKATDENIALVSGFSPSILSGILSGKIENFTPLGIALNTLQNSRYDRIVSS